MALHRWSWMAIIAVFALTACGGGSESSSNVSSATSSVVPSSSSTAPTSTITLEEGQAGFCSLDGVIESQHSGFQGVGYANSSNTAGSYIHWQVQSNIAQTVSLQWRFANGGDAARPASVEVNGTSSISLPFGTSGNWADYQILSATVYLEAGSNDIFLIADSSTGLANIDSLTLSGLELTASPCSTSTSSSSVANQSSSTSSSNGEEPLACEQGDTRTEWATTEQCGAPVNQCVSGQWKAPKDGGETRAPLRAESDHFAIYWPDGTNIDLATAQTALNTLEMIWQRYFGAPVYFPEPYCNRTEKWKTAVHIDNDFPLWGGDWSRNGQRYLGMWIGPLAAKDPWGLAHEFMHGVQALTAGFPECGGNGCWIYESHANWMPHQIFRDNVHCSELLVNAPHLHFGNTRNRYCNWQFFEFVKDRFCPQAINNMWTLEAPVGQRDPFQKLMYGQNWDLEKLNDVFGQWAMHNITWDYQDPDGNPQGEIYRNAYGAITQTDISTSERRLRLTQLESLDGQWQENRRFASPFYWAPQRWGYNVVQLFPEDGATEIQVKFRGVQQPGADSGWRWGLVATDNNLRNPRYSSLKRGDTESLRFCLNGNEKLFLVVLAAPTKYQKIPWVQPSDGTPYPHIYRYPYTLELSGAWPQGFQNGQRSNCPAGLVRHSHGGGCAPANTPASVYVGPYATIYGGTVSGNARIEDHAAIVRGTVSENAVVGALSTLGLRNRNASFSVLENAQLHATFYPMGWFTGNSRISGDARYIGDLEVYSANKTTNTFYGLVDDNWQGVPYIEDINIPPPYLWRD